MGVIEIEGLSRAFGDLTVFEDVSLDIPEGRTTAVIGPSGAGKSVLLKHIVGLLRPDAGRVRVFGVDVARATEAELYAVRRRLGMLFQNGALFDSMSVGENVVFPLEHHATSWTAGQRRHRAEEKLELVGMPGFFDRRTADLSGGQRKRVGLARAIVMEPEIVLFDEPNSGLDPLSSDAIDQLIDDMKAELGVTFLVISHDIVGVACVADHIAMLSGGRLVAWGEAAAVLSSDVPVVRQFLRRNLGPGPSPVEVAATSNPE